MLAYYCQCTDEQFNPTVHAFVHGDTKAKPRLKPSYPSLHCNPSEAEEASVEAGLEPDSVTDILLHSFYRQGSAVRTAHDASPIVISKIRLAAAGAESTRATYRFPVGQ